MTDQFVEDSCFRYELMNIHFMVSGGVATCHVLTAARTNLIHKCIHQGGGARSRHYFRLSNYPL